MNAFPPSTIRLHSTLTLYLAICSMQIVLKTLRRMAKTTWIGGFMNLWGCFDALHYYQNCHLPYKSNAICGKWLTFYSLLQSVRLYYKPQNLSFRYFHVAIRVWCSNYRTIWQNLIFCLLQILMLLAYLCLRTKKAQAIMQDSWTHSTW